METDKRKKIALVAAMLMFVFAFVQLAFDFMRDLFGAVASLLAGFGLLLMAISSSKSQKGPQHGIEEIESSIKFVTIWIYVGAILGGVSGYFTLTEMNYSVVIALLLSLIITVIVVLLLKFLVKTIIARRAQRGQ